MKKRSTITQAELSAIALKENDWFDYGMTDHLESDQFPHWTDIAREAARLIGAEPESEMEAVLFTVAAAAAKVGWTE